MVLTIIIAVLVIVSVSFVAGVYLGPMIKSDIKKQEKTISDVISKLTTVAEKDKQTVTEEALDVLHKL